ncbi:MAG: endospore germination permease [Bacillota bacterium]|nr:endospore germination permease [Bacillota bacterium]
MYKEQITDKQGICLLSLFIMGSTLIVGTGGTAKNDAWIAGIAGIIMAVPIIFVYSKILVLFPGMDLYEILNVVLGKLVGNIVAVIYIWYGFHLGALVMRNFGEFINTMTMPETPLIFPMLCLALVDVIAVKSGVEVMARISALVLPFLLFIIALVELLAIPQLKFHFIKPILGEGIAPVLMGAFNTFSFPYAETFIFTAAAFALKSKKSIYKVYFISLFFAGTLIIMLTLRNILILGGTLGTLYFPSHVAVSIIRLGEFLERIEVTVAIVFVFGAFIKSALCLFAVCKGIARVFNLTDYKSIVIQTGLLMTYFAYIVYDNIMLMQLWAFKVYPFYAFPFQVILPLLILIAAELKKRKKPKC